jgi:hypothetical protein
MPTHLSILNFVSCTPSIFQSIESSPGKQRIRSLRTPETAVVLGPPQEGIVHGNGQVRRSGSGGIEGDASEKPAMHYTTDDLVTLKRRRKSATTEVPSHHHTQPIVQHTTRPPPRGSGPKCAVPEQLSQH